MDELSYYDYTLPPELIATVPAPKRDDARLLVLDRTTGDLRHERISVLPEFLRPGDTLVLNDTRVIPARIRGHRVATGGKWEGLYLGRLPEGHWRLMCQTRGRLREGERILVSSPQQPEGAFELELISRGDQGIWTAHCHDDVPALELLQQHGEIPLPPYMGNRAPDAHDEERYQTTFAQRPGAVAAPTAGLHFTPELLDACRKRDVRTVFVTLHVGIGTFRPIAVDRLSEHQMHEEWCEVSPETAEVLNATRAAGGRIICVGTTSVRTLESAARDGRVLPFSGTTNLFIKPGFVFQATEGLLTNFHLPKSTLLVLFSALAGRDRILHAYESAIAASYRFYSYGDAMLIV